MVTICTKKFTNTREKLLLHGIKKKHDDQDLEAFFTKLKNQREDVSKTRILSGTSLPNSTIRSLLSVSSSKNLPCKELSKNSLTSQPQRSSAILTGTETLEELMQLKELLHKSSYVPKKPTNTRRNTIDKIKSAIEKERRQNLIRAEEEDKKSDEESLEDLEHKETNDASTCTIKKKAMKKKRVKKRVTNNLNLSSTNGTVINEEKKKVKGRKFKKKLSEKVNVEIQCSLFRLSNK